MELSEVKMIEMRNINYGTKMQVEIILHVWNYWKGEDHDKQMITSSDVINLQKPKLQITRKDNFGQTTFPKHLKKELHQPMSIIWDCQRYKATGKVNFGQKYWIYEQFTILSKWEVNALSKLTTVNSQLSYEA